jgi:signal transduction histidine kinase
MRTDSGWIYRDQVNVARRWVHAMRRHPRYVDLAIAAGVYLATIAPSAFEPVQVHNVPLARGTVVVGVVCGVLVLRRRWPFVVLVLTIMGAEAYLMAPGTNVMVLAAPLVALYTVADTAGWRWSLTIGAPAVGLLVALHVLIRPPPDFGQENLTLIACGALAIAAGAASRERRAYVKEVEERARQAERDREEDARRRVGEERLRIARDVHDMVGHHLALINVQAAVAVHVLEDQPGKAREALEHIMDASRSGLGDLREVIGLLREPGDPADPTEPNEGMRGLDELVATFRRSGLRIDQIVEGESRPIPSAADLTAYRVIQESLTNVRKHAGNAATTVRLGYEPDALRIVVENDGTGGPAERNGAAPGHGIDGMRERVAALGGSLLAERRPGGGFQVEVLLPVPMQGAR